MWRDLSIRDKADFIHKAVREGYNSGFERLYDEGGLVPSEPQPEEPPMGRGNQDNYGNYLQWIDLLAQKKSEEWDEPYSFVYIDMLNNNTYDYKAFYDEDPQRAWEYLSSPEGAHFDDVGKTVYHPSFSNESMYSANNYGDMGTGANPDNITGPAWNDNNQLIDQEGNVVFDENVYDKGGMMDGPDDPKKGTLKRRTVLNSEYTSFINNLKQNRLPENIKASQNSGYWKNNWYDPAYRNNKYSFDENGLMTYNGQTYSPYGNRINDNGIVVPVRTPNGMSYGENIVYYPVSVPQQFIEEEYYEPVSVINPDDNSEIPLTGTNPVLKKNIAHKSANLNTKKTKNQEMRVFSVSHNPYSNLFVNRDLSDSMWSEYRKRENNKTLTDEYKKEFDKALKILGDYESKSLRNDLYFAPDSISPAKKTSFIKDRNEYRKLGFSKEAPHAAKKITDDWIGKFNYVERYKPSMSRTDILTFNPETGKLSIKKGNTKTTYNNFNKEAVGAKYILTPKAVGHIIKESAENAKEGIRNFFSGKGVTVSVQKPGKTETWGNTSGLAYGGNLYDEGGIIYPDDPPSVKVDYKYHFDRATKANRHPSQFADKEYEVITGKKYTGYVKNTVEKSPIGKQALHEYLTESGKDFNDYEFEDYTNRRTYPAMYEVYDADKNFVTKALERENIIPLDYSKTITLSNAGTLTGAKIPASLLEIVKNKADSLKESPYTLLGIMGKETTFGKNNPYTFNVTKEDYINNSLPEEGIKVGKTYYRSVSDLSNNHHYFISPVRGEINQVYRNTGMEFSKALEYGHPDYLLNDNPLPTPEFAKWFNTRNMKTASVQSFKGPIMDDWGAMMESYNKKRYANMPEIYEKIETLKKSPELRKYFGK